MKTAIKTLAFILSLTFTLNVFAKAGNPTGDAKPEGGKSLYVNLIKEGIVTLKYEGEHQGPATVLILDAEKNVVFTEKVKSVFGFTRAYNIIDLPASTYTFKVMDYNNSEIEQSLDISTKSTALNVEVSGNEAGKYDLLLKGTKDEVIYISIYDQFSNIVYNESVLADGNIKVPFDLNALAAGNYTFEIYNGTEIISKNIFLKK